MIHIQRIRHGRAHCARGATLLIGMILLLLMSAVALTSLKAIKTEERMAGNLQDRYLAFQAAEAALREAEELLSQPSLPPFGAAMGLYRYDQTDIPTAFGFATGNAREYRNDLGVVARRPLYIIEQMEPGVEQGASLVVGTRYGTDMRATYRITAIGYGGAATTRAVLQSSYRR
ncbi:pilus assembly PilX family protein [Candidatus Thiodictyon syntrophicum]|jgi:type IV pilus assembly protein PilX|uniref:Type 4 fimbrial biogenesis protein PilX N-terminal domain-containing protein n=1 Tax=Candidatus Thiodictyon syntrophicum TaxID=1166950 RepID=A0A2K8U8Z1_9GAMM|nr:pilus assembly protein [Candidatus Thiodictyon syntrophicum]AUB81879.1 hypothetical protein THSYN_13525 [Candidatus Thiodictyon syntrophicum]